MMDSFSLQIPLRLHVELHEDIVWSELDADRAMRDFIRILNDVQCERIPRLQRSNVTGMSRAGSFELNGAIQLVFDSQKSAQDAYLEFDQREDIYKDVITTLRLQFPGNIRKGYVELGRPQVIANHPFDAPFTEEGLAYTRFEFGDRGLSPSDPESGGIAHASASGARKDHRYSALWILPLLMLGLLALSFHNTRTQSEQSRRIERLTAQLSDTQDLNSAQQTVNEPQTTDLETAAQTPPAQDTLSGAKAPADPIILDIRIETDGAVTRRRVELPAAPASATAIPHTITLSAPRPPSPVTPPSQDESLAGGPITAPPPSPDAPRWTDFGDAPPAQPDITRAAFTRASAQ